MPVQAPPLPPPTVRRFKIEIDDSFVQVDFGYPMPWEDARRRIQDAAEAVYPIVDRKQEPNA